MNNKGPQPLDIQPTLFSLDGQRLDVPPVTVDGTSFQLIDLRQWAVPGAGFDEGSLQIVHYGMDMQLGAQVKMIDADHSLIFAEQLMQMMSMSSRLEGVWWVRSPRCNVRLVLSNTSDTALTTAVSIEGVSPRQTGSLTMNLTSHETRILDLVSLAGNGKGTLHEIGGLSVTYNGAPGALLARGLIDEPSTGFSSSIEFSDPSMAHSSKLDGGGLRLSPTAGTQLTPVVVARNIGTTESIIRGSMPYTLDDGSASLVPIPEIRLRPGEVSTLDVSRAIRRSHLDLERVVSAGLEFTYSSAPGSVLMSAQSVSSDGDQVFRLPFIDADAEPSSTGGYPWRIDGDSSTFVYITNVTDRSQQYALELNFQGGVYAPGLKTIGPNQTAVVDVRALRDAQVADEHGNTIPGSKSSGQANWSVIGGENLVLIGRAEQADLVKGMSSSYACVNCCPSSCAQTWVDPGSVIGFLGDATQFAPMQQNEDCFGNFLTPFSVSGASWSSSNTAVATVDTSGFATAQSVGTTNIGAIWSAWLWDMNPNNTCFKTHIFPSPTALCDVFGQDVHFTTVSLLDTDRQATFLLNVAMLNIRTTTGPDACGGDSFWIRARFDLPEFNSGCCSGPDTLARLDANNQFILLDAAFFENESHLSGFADVRLKRVNNQASGNRLQIHIAGTFQNGSSYTSLGLVRLTCP